MRVFALMAVLCLAASAWASEAAKLYKEGRKAQKAGQYARAYLLYSEAAAQEPDNRIYWLRAEALRTQADLQAKVEPPRLVAGIPTAGAEPEEPVPEATPEDWAAAREPLPPTRLAAAPGRKDFDLRGNFKTLFEGVAHAFGLDCVFDGDYQPGHVIRFQMQQAGYRTALHALEAATGSFLVPISSKLFLVVKDTPQKRREEEPYVAIIVPLPEPTSIQELTSMVTAVQQACGIQKVSWDSQKNVVIMRDAISKVLPARALFEELLHPRAQVQIEMQFLEVSSADMLDYGLALPNSFPVVSFSDLLHSTPSIASNLAGMLLFGGGESMLGIGIVNSTLLASLSRSSGDVLLSGAMRSVDGQPASMHVGEKYPILTAGYYGPSNFSGPGAYTPPPSFTFEDLGLSLKATPHVHGVEDVTLDVEAEFKVLTGSSMDGIPIISNRSLKSVVSVKFNQWAVIAGLLSDQDARTLSGIAGVAKVPLLGPLMSHHTHDKESHQVLILLKPELLTLPPDQYVTHVLRMGSEARPLTPL
jgi:general secretion pathway protein D